MTKQEIQDKLDKINKSLNSPATPDNVKPGLNKRKAELEKELLEYKEPEKPAKKEKKAKLKFKVGDEGMFQGGEYLIEKIIDTNKYQIIELDEKGKKSNKTPEIISQSKFEESFAKFPKIKKQSKPEKKPLLKKALQQKETKDLPNISVKDAEKSDSETLEKVKDETKAKTVKVIKKKEPATPKTQAEKKKILIRKISNNIEKEATPQVKKILKAKGIENKLDNVVKKFIDKLSRIKDEAELNKVLAELEKLL